MDVAARRAGAVAARPRVAAARRMHGTCRPVGRKVITSPPLPPPLRTHANHPAPHPCTRTPYPPRALLPFFLMAARQVTLRATWCGSSTTRCAPTPSICCTAARRCWPSVGECPHGTLYLVSAPRAPGCWRFDGEHERRGDIRGSYAFLIRSKNGGRVCVIVLSSTVAREVRVRLRCW